MNKDHYIQRHLHEFRGNQPTGLSLGKYVMKYHYILTSLHSSLGTGHGDYKEAAGLVVLSFGAV